MGIEVCAEGGVDGLSAFGFRDVSGIEAIDDAGEYVGHRVAETGNATCRAILQCPENEMIWAGIDLKTFDLLRDLEIGFQCFLRAT